MTKVVYTACRRANVKRITGKDLTPFLLEEVVKLTKGKSLKVNIHLALNNIKLGIKVLNRLFGS